MEQIGLGFGLEFEIFRGELPPPVARGPAVPENDQTCVLIPAHLEE